MLISRNHTATTTNAFYLLVVVLLLCSLRARSQDAVSFLKAKTVEPAADFKPVGSGNEQPFDFTRNLIFFDASVNGEPGRFILDTGAPTLLLNSRGEITAGHERSSGQAAGGSVALATQRIESFEMGGRTLAKHWALALDLRSMESRTGKRIDGYVGHKFLRGGEVRIDFPGRKFQLLRSSRFPRHAGQSPRKVLRFEYDDHLPVITVKVGKRKLRFAVDTGAGTNLIDEKYRDLMLPTGARMNIQGLDGSNANHDIVRLFGMPCQDEDEATNFVVMDLSHLQTYGEPPISGILGSVFLADHIVGIDFRRRKLYFW